MYVCNVYIHWSIYHVYIITNKLIYAHNIRLYVNVKTQIFNVNVTQKIRCFPITYLTPKQVPRLIVSRKLNGADFFYSKMFSDLPCTISPNDLGMQKIYKFVRLIEISYTYTNINENTI